MSIFRRWVNGAAYMCALPGRCMRASEMQKICLFMFIYINMLMYFQKAGKWCSAHVRVAWEIHMHQQKQKVEGSRSADATLAPPSHLPPPPSAVGLHRPELASSLLGTGRL